MSRIKNLFGSQIARYYPITYNKLTLNNSLKSSFKNFELLPGWATNVILKNNNGF
jgi:hypothetical protein